MSVDLTHYLGIGLQLPVDFDKYDEVIDKYPQYSRYQFIREKTKVESNVRLIEDGMNGTYTYLMYVIKETDQEDMYSNSSLGELYVNNVGMARALHELQEAYPLFTEEELQINNVKILSLFHCS